MGTWSRDMISGDKLISATTLLLAISAAFFHGGVFQLKNHPLKKELTPILAELDYYYDHYCYICS